MSMDEAELLDRCRRGEQEAFRQLVEQHHARMYRTAHAMCLDAEAAQDVVQDALLRAWRGLPHFRGEAALATWLTRLTLNAARDHSRRSRTKALLGRVVRCLRPETDDPWPGVADADEVAGLLRLVSVQVRELVWLRYGLDLTVSDIAAILGCPEGTVKSRLHRALGELRHAAEKWPASEGARLEVSHG